MADHLLKGQMKPVRQSLRLLFVDDDMPHLALVKRRLARLGFEIASAQDGETALGMVLRETFDVIGLDVNLPDRTGIDVLHELRGRGNTTPVVCITGMNDAAVAVEALKSGARDFIVKSGESAYFDLLGNALRQAYETDAIQRARAEAESSRDILMRELAHRVKNQLAVVSSIATSSGRRATDVQSFVRDFGARIQAISASYDLLFQADWQPVSVETVVRGVLRISIGEVIDANLPPLRIDPQTVQALSLALHELGTNAVQHGALAASGSLALRGDVDIVDGERFLVIEWAETGGGATCEPEKRGFGLTMSQNVLAQLDGGATFQWRPDGLRAQLRLRIDQPVQLAATG